MTTRRKARSRALETLGRMYATGQVPAQPSLFEPILIDEELREASPGCAAHYDRLNGMRSYAEEYFAGRLTKCESPEARSSLLVALETLRDSTTAEPVTTTNENWFRAEDVELMRASIAPVAERAQEAMIAINEGRSLDVVWALLAEMRATEQVLDWTFSTAATKVAA